MVGSGTDNDGHGGNSGSGAGSGGNGNGHRPSDRPGGNWRNPNKNEDRYGGGNRYGGTGDNRAPNDIPGGPEASYGRPPYDRYPEPGDYGRLCSKMLK